MSQSGKLSEIHDELVYLPSDESGKIVIPMTGWDIRQICAGGYTAAVDYAKEENVAKWLCKYSDELIFNEAKQCSDCDAEELSNEDRMSRLGYIIFSFAFEIKEYEDPDIFLGNEKIQKIWGLKFKTAAGVKNSAPDTRRRGSLRRGR